MPRIPGPAKSCCESREASTSSYHAARARTLHPGALGTAPRPSAPSVPQITPSRTLPTAGCVLPQPGAFDTTGRMPSQPGAMRVFGSPQTRSRTRTCPRPQDTVHPGVRSTPIPRARLGMLEATPRSMAHTGRGLTALCCLFTSKTFECHDI